MKFKIIILTKNEELHLKRCIDSVRVIATEIWVIDSHSSDETTNIAAENGAQVISREWPGYSEQFNFAIDHVTQEDDWVFRIDADEVVDESTIDELRDLSEAELSSFNGISILRSIAYNGEVLCGEPYFKVPITRIFRSGFGRYERRPMDEHLLISGATYQSQCHVIDECLKGRNFFKSKHENYARLEALSIQNQYSTDLVDKDTQKRKKHRDIYYKFPILVRPFLLYLYFLFIKRGILKGWNYNIFLAQQVLEYRLLVDIVLVKDKFQK